MGSAGQNMDRDGKHESQMEELRTTPHLGRKAGKPQKGPGQNQPQKVISKPFIFHSVSN
jgi:hypothetical protein